MDDADGGSTPSDRSKWIIAHEFGPVVKSRRRFVPVLPTSETRRVTDAKSRTQVVDIKFSKLLVQAQFSEGSGVTSDESVIALPQDSI